MNSFGKLELLIMSTITITWICSCGTCEHSAGASGCGRWWCSTDRPWWHMGTSQGDLHTEPTAPLH